MATSATISGGGIRLPAIDTTLTKPMDVLGSIASGLALGDAVSDIPNKVRGRKVIAQNQEKALSGEFPTTKLTIGADGRVAATAEDPLTYELSRALDRAKVQTEGLQGQNYQSQIDERQNLLPSKQAVFDERANELRARTNAILSPEVIEQVTPSGEKLQIVTGPSGAREIGKPTSANRPSVEVVEIEGIGKVNKVGSRLFREDGSEVLAPTAAERKQAATPQGDGTDPYAPYIRDPKIEQKEQEKWIKEDPSDSAAGRLNQLDRLEVLTDEAIQGPVVGGAADAVLGANKEMKSITAGLAAEMRKPGTGSVSDADLKAMQAQVPSSSNPKATNKNIINAMRAAAQRELAASTFINELRAEGYSISQAKRIAKEYGAENRLFGKNEDGSLVINQGPDMGTWFEGKRNKKKQVKQQDPKTGKWYRFDMDKDGNVSGGTEIISGAAEVQNALD